MNVGIVVAFGAMIFVTWSIISTIPSVFDTPSVSILIPGVDMPGSSIYVPFISGLIALATVVIIHEFSHGIQSVCEKIPIKSIGLLLFLILPGAFVEPDEESLKSSKKSSRLRVCGRFCCKYYFGYCCTCFSVFNICRNSTLFCRGWNCY